MTRASVQSHFTTCPACSRDNAIRTAHFGEHLQPDRPAHSGVVRTVQTTARSRNAQSLAGDNSRLCGGRFGRWLAAALAVRLRKPMLTLSPTSLKSRRDSQPTAKDNGPWRRIVGHSMLFEPPMLNRPRLFNPTMAMVAAGLPNTDRESASQTPPPLILPADQPIAWSAASARASSRPNGSRTARRATADRGPAGGTDRRR